MSEDVFYLEISLASHPNCQPLLINSATVGSLLSAFALKFDLLQVLLVLLLKRGDNGEWGGCLRAAEADGRIIGTGCAWKLKVTLTVTEQ